MRDDKTTRRDSAARNSNFSERDVALARLRPRKLKINRTDSRTQNSRAREEEENEEEERECGGSRTTNVVR